MTFALMLALVFVWVPIHAKAASLKGQSVYGTSGTDLWSGGSIGYGSGASLLTTNGLIVHCSNSGLASTNTYGAFGSILSNWQGAWADLSDIAINTASTPPPTGSLSVNKSQGGAGGVQLNWSVTPSPTN
ncbi:MAG: hypothetical protein PW734_07920 [Verrucomicrobium sp.]|nr:hypothetical protein [Verrucomicrobium sp.]